MNKTRKTILLGISINHGISELIIKNLEYCGFNVLDLAPYVNETEKFKYPSMLDYLYVKLRRVLFRDKQAKIKLQSEILLKNIKPYLTKNEIDYSLFFLAQNFSQELVQYIKEKTPKGNMINYQWDGINRYPRIYERLPLFDRTYVFDPIDLNNESHQFYPATSFYFDYDLSPLPEEYDFYFLGSHIEDRAELIIKFSQFAKNQNWNIKFDILCDKNKHNFREIYPENVMLLDLTESKSYAENILNAKKSKVLVDFVISAHKGLSLRTFEALGYNKKLITTNKEIIKYDFYHPNNIFVLDNNWAELEDFLDKPYVEIDNKIKCKYAFSNWIRYILDIKPYNEISLPKI